MKLATTVVVFCVAISLLYPRAAACVQDDYDLHAIMSQKLEELDKLVFSNGLYKPTMGFAGVTGKLLANPGLKIRGRNVGDRSCEEQGHVTVVGLNGGQNTAGTSFPVPLDAAVPSYSGRTYYAGSYSAQEWSDKDREAYKIKLGGENLRRLVFSHLEQYASEEDRKAAREVNVKDIQELNFDKSQITCHGELCKIVRGAQCTLQGGLDHGKCEFNSTLSFGFNDLLDDNPFMKIECLPVKSRPGFVQQGSCRLHMEFAKRVNANWFIEESVFQNTFRLERAAYELARETMPQVMVWYHNTRTAHPTFIHYLQRLDEWLAIVLKTTKEAMVMTNRCVVNVISDMAKLVSREMFLAAILLTCLIMAIHVFLFWLWLRVLWKVWTSLRSAIFGCHTTNKNAQIAKKTCQDCGIELPNSL